MTPVPPKARAPKAKPRAAKGAPRYQAFYDQVPHLFEASKPAWEKGYNELIYRMERPLTKQNVRDVLAWVGGKAPALDGVAVAQLNEVLLRIRWPDVRRLARLRALGLSLPQATALQHFHNPSFPPFTAEAVAGYAQVAKRVRRPEALTLDNLRAYRRWMDALVELKEGIPFRDVPESHYFHVWVLECALAEAARAGNGHRKR